MPKVSFLFGGARHFQMGLPAILPTSQKVTSGDVPLVDSTLIELNASVQEIHEVAAEISDHPLEVGSLISDHYRILPKKLRVEGIITEELINPFGLPSQLTNLASGPINLVRKISGSLIGGESRIDQQYRRLLAHMDNALLLTVVTTLRIYENMVISSVSVTRTAASGNILDLVIELREIQQVPTTSIPIVGAASNFGQVSKTPAEEAKTAANITVLKRIVNFFLKPFGGF